MKTLPNEIKTLKRIKFVLDKLMADNKTPVEIRSTDLYPHSNRDLVLRKQFPNQREFNRFLRKQHDSGLMKQIIPNYRVDTSNKTFYQWFFRRDTNELEKNRNGEAETLSSNYNYYKQTKLIKVSNGEYVNSIQEKVIYEKLLNQKRFIIRHDHPVRHFGEVKYVDFFILDTSSKMKFFWEHFGMTNKENYKDDMASKIIWYKNNGYKTIDKGGNLIYSYYVDDNSFLKQIENIIRLIITRTNRLS